MALTLEQAAGQKFLLSFVGKEKPPKELLEIFRRHHVGGVVLFRHKNMGSLAEVRALTALLQKVAGESRQTPLLIAADQEGGQLMAVGEATPFPGNMALGATRSPRLAYRVGRALGRELAALGINVNFAPVCDVNNNPRNPVIGTRSFGEDPRLVASLSAAFIRGLQSSGVAATAKHFPGHGDTSSDSHRGAPILRHDLKRIRSVELVPFRAAIRAHVGLVMTAHIIMPALNGNAPDLPATLSPDVLRSVLRKQLGFKGVIVSDALDMHALEQGEAYIGETLAAAAAGNDLLLFNHELARFQPAYENLLQAARRRLISANEMQASARRILALKKWTQRVSQPPIAAIGCQEHRRLAEEVAQKSITLVRNRAGVLPLWLSADKKIAVVTPRPQDLTPADTSSYIKPELAGAVRRYHEQVSDFSVGLDPASSEIEDLTRKLADYDVVIMGTINAIDHPGQARLVNRILKKSPLAITVALRMPYDVAAYPSVSTYLCTYSVLPTSMEALAAAIFGRIPFRGQLPTTIPE